jgi:hypothetical protein
VKRNIPLTLKLSPLEENPRPAELGQGTLDSNLHGIDPAIHPIVAFPSVPGEHLAGGFGMERHRLGR